MARTESVAVPAGRVTVVFTSRADGDFAVDAPRAELAARRASVVDAPWTWLRQVHGADLVTVTSPGAGAGNEADGIITAEPECPLAIMTADCAPVLMISEVGIAAVHAGWRGLVAGIIQNAAARLGAMGGEPVTTMIGPCINPAAYEFGPEELGLVTDCFGSVVRAETAWGAPALDVPKAVSVACEQAGWPPPSASPACTSGEEWYSHRIRAEAARQATVAWLQPDAEDGVQ